MRVCLKEDNDEFPSVPPGFESFTSFSLKRVNDSEKQDSENLITCNATTSTSGSQSVPMETGNDVADVAKRSQRRRPGINNRRYNNYAEDESDYESLDQVSVAVHLCSLRFNTVHISPIKSYTS